MADTSSADAAARDGFARAGYAAIPALTDPGLTGYLWSYIHTKFAAGLLSKGDARVPLTPSAYADHASEGLLEYLRPRLEAVADRRLVPTYSYLRLYKKGDILKRHHDRPACEFSISLNVGQRPAAPWPFFVAGREGTASVLLSPGDAVLYRGHELFHWRERFEGQQMAQIFLHYVDPDGPHAAQKFDSRAALMRPPVPLSGPPR